MSVYEPAEDSYFLREFIGEMNLEGSNCLDMGTGSGILAVEMAEQGGDVLAVDSDKKALKRTMKNAENEGYEDSISVRKSDLFKNVEESFDFIFFNPPYLPGERKRGDSLVGGGDGVRITLKFLDNCDRYLCDGAKAFFLASDRSNIEELERRRIKLVETKKLWFEELRIYRTEASFL